MSEFKTLPCTDDIVLLGCFHAYCEACIEEWWGQASSKSCPVCRQPVLTKLPQFFLLFGDRTHVLELPSTTTGHILAQVVHDKIDAHSTSIYA